MAETINGHGREYIEQLTYSPGLQDSTDLEATTKTISATAEAGVADYSAALTIAAPADTRLAVTRLGVRLQVTIDSWTGAGATLNYRIKRGATSIATGTLATGAATGAKVVVADVTAGTLTGAATYTVYLWVNADTCVVSLCELWVGVGSTSQNTYRDCVTLTHVGHVAIMDYVVRQGSGTLYQVVTPALTLNSSRVLYLTSASQSGGLCEGDLAAGASLGVCSDAATDLTYLYDFAATLRSAL